MNFDLYEGDCLQVMKTLPDGCVDLSVFSPPYNLSEGGNFGLPSTSNDVGRGKWKNAKLRRGYASHRDNMPYPEYVEWQKEVLRETWRLTSDDGAIFYQHKPRILNGRVRLPTDLVPEELRDNLRQIVIWNRSRGFNFNASFFMSTHEWIVIIAKEKWRLRSQGVSGLKDVWDIKPEKPCNDHPAPFPVELPQRAIHATAAKTVFDPFLGSGSTGIAAANEGRSFIGIELDKGYLANATARICEAVNRNGGGAIQLVHALKSAA